MSTESTDSSKHLGVKLLLRQFRLKVLVTWLIVLVENLLMALLPLFIGRAIDALLNQQPGALWEVSLVMAALIVVSVARRIYDTRAYGSMRVWFGSKLVARSGDDPVSQVNARLEMSREMVDFLEVDVPECITAAVQIVVSIVVLWSFDRYLGLSALSVIAVLAIIYSLFDRRFYRLNGQLNTQREKQVKILSGRKASSLLSHLRRLRASEVRLSDTEAVLYGLIFAAMFAFVIANIWLASTLAAITAGMIFAILSYSWELVESGVTLPYVLQKLTRLTEISNRINQARE